MRCFLFKLKLWTIVQLKNPIWHIDATGGIINKINGQRKPFLYSIVVHDLDKKLIFPIAEFFSTANDAKSIASYFADIKLEFLKKIPKNGLFKVAPIIVTDFSWGLINAIMETFNNCTVTIYINWCFEIIFKKSECIILASIMKSIFQLCSVHFLKLIITKARKIKPFKDEGKDKKLQNDFIFAFTLLQNSINIDEFSEYFKHIFNIFNLKFITFEHNESCNKMKQQLLDRNLTIIKYNESFDGSNNNQNKADKIKSHQVMIVDDDFQEDSLKNVSPFTAYFDALIKQHEIEINRKHKNKYPKEINLNYCPQLFSILLDYIHILPFWTGIMLQQWKRINPNYSILASKLDNNPVENQFRQIKHNLFESLPVMPSQYTSRMNLRLDAICVENYKNELKNAQLNKLKHYSDATEPWQDRKKTRIKGKNTFYDKPGSKVFEQPNQSNEKGKK
jgi:hypothetical protein